MQGKIDLIHGAISKGDYYSNQSHRRSVQRCKRREQKANNDVDVFKRPEEGVKVRRRWRESNGRCRRRRCKGGGAWQMRGREEMIGGKGDWDGGRANGI